MNLTPATFEVTEIPGGRRYRLPSRGIGGVRFVAIAPLVLAVMGCAFFVHLFLAQTAKGPLNEWEWSGFIVIGLAWARGFYTLVSYAAAIWCGRTEIEVGDDGSARAWDRAGWFRVRWGRLKPGAARKLILKEFFTGPEPAKRPPPKPGEAPPLWTLLVETDREHKVWLVPGYTLDVLTPLAELLAKQLVVATPQPADAIDTPAIPVVALPVEVEQPEVPKRDVPDQPPKSRVKLERHSDGVTITVPPLGILKSYGGLVVIGVLFGGIGVVMLVAMIAPLLQANPPAPDRTIIIGVLFSCIGGVVLLSCIQSGRKKVVLAVVGNRLLTFETGPLGSRRREFAHDNLLDIACGPSTVSVNHKPLPQLQIIPHDKSQVGILTGRDESELMWIATVLRQSLSIPSEPPEYRKPPTVTAEAPANPSAEKIAMVGSDQRRPPSNTSWR